MNIELWPERAETLRAELVAAGKLTSPRWQAAVLAVPRHRFVPEFYRRGSAGWELVSVLHDDTSEQWWQGVYGNTSLVTRVGTITNGARSTSGPTSSSSAPGLMTRMLEALDLHDGHRVLEVGTGTGYNAALMSHRLGDAHVFSVEVDVELAAQARRHLAELGYHPTIVATDGAYGLPEHAPYDRVIATCAVSRIPWSWADQTAEGGLVLADLKINASIGNLVLLRREPDRLEGRFDPGYATFMHMRTPTFEADPPPMPVRDHRDAERRSTTLMTERVWENAPLWFLLHLREPGRVDFGYSMDPTTGDPGLVYFASSDGSWCELTAERDGTRTVWEGGPRRLWASIEAATEFWDRHGKPHWDRFGLTARSADSQTVWLDDPDDKNRWSIAD
ncbi:MAG: methyltransferase domain-containing protein [Pseudonocardiales bacterium]|nr:methyltransferase domain-containing protein [Pseudonocardiales bacterium]